MNSTAKPKKHSYYVGYLYRYDSHGTDFANGMGPIERNLTQVGGFIAGKSEAIEFGARQIGTIPEGRGRFGLKIRDMYLVEVSREKGNEYVQVVGEICKDGTLVDMARPRKATR